MRTVYLLQLGKGNIGKTLIAQVLQQSARLESHYGLGLRYIGLADRQHLLIAREGLNQPLAEYGPEKLLATHPKRRPRADWNELIQILKQLNHHPLVVIDLTAADTTALHLGCLQCGISVVTANKRPLSGRYAGYRQIQETARRTGCFYQYETTVGAGLPVIQPLQELLASGDEVVEISGSFSGSLAYICSALERGCSFAEAVCQARIQGYTEPDPRDDLTGTDVARKLLILAREIGHQLNFTDIRLQSMIPPGVDPDGSVEAFMARLPQADSWYQQRVQASRARNNVLRYLAVIRSDHWQVGLHAVPAASPIGQVKGPGNVIVIRSRRYCNDPLTVAGPGAGREVTAAGVFGDILKIARGYGRGE